MAYEAIYTPNTYTVKFNANGGSGTMAYESFTYDVSKALTANAFTRNGWNFLGWADSADATTAKYTDGQSVKNLATSGTKNLYAVWWHPGVQLWENGPFWAECNIGATQPTQAGGYFWWGDTVGYKRVGSSWNALDGSVTGFSFSSANCATYGKTLSQLKSAGFVDSIGRLVSAHDAAFQKLGAPWRMPTYQEMVDLVSTKVTLAWVTKSGVRGLEVTGKGNFSSKSIFLPLAGYASGNNIENFDSNLKGYYWTSDYYDNSGVAYSLRANASGTYDDNESSAINVYIQSRYRGLLIRPVISANQ